MRTFVNFSKPEAVSAIADAAVKASAAFMGALADELPSESFAAMHQVMVHGGRVGVETLLDVRGNPTLALVAIEREGMRRVIAEFAGRAQ